jgi:hypothetical protein
VELVPPVASTTAAWEGGWVLGVAGAAAGAAAGTATGWLFLRWILPEVEKQRERWIAVGLPAAFAVFFAFFGAYRWATASPATLDDAWGIAIFLIAFAFLGALVRRPILGLLAASPLALLQLVLVVASMAAGWDGGWALGAVGAAAGAAAGAATGWLYARWIMPEYEKRRARVREQKGDTQLL